MDARRYETNADFTLIYEAAKSGNHHALAGLMDQNVCIDVHDHRGLFTPAGRLAAEGHHEAVKLLHGLGANGDYIAMGYASEGYVQEAEIMRKKFGANIKHLAIGAAMYHDSSYAEQLRQKFSFNTAWLMFGASLVRSKTYIASLQALEKNKKALEKVLRVHVKGLVMGGFESDVLAILDSNKDSESDLLLRVAIEAAARVSNAEFLAKLLIRNGTSPFVLDYYHQIAAVGAAKGGNLALAKKLFEQTNRRDEQVSLIAAAGVKHGHLNETVKYFGSLLKSDQAEFIRHQLALRSTLRGKHKHVVEKINKIAGSFVGSAANYNDFAALCARHGDLSVAASTFKFHHVLPVDIVKAMDKGGHFHNERLLMHTLAFIDDHAFVDALSSAALVLNSDQEAAKSVKTLYQGFNAIFENKCFISFKECAHTAKKINHLMRKYDFNFDQAEAFLKSKDLRGIMQSLIFMPGGISAFTVGAFKPSLLGAEGLGSDDLADMMEKFAFNIAKNHVERELAAYLERNYIAYYQHYNRAFSLNTAVKAVKSREELKSLSKFQIGLFDGTIMVIPDAGRPKHEQPLSRAISKEDDMYITMDKINKNPRINN